MRSAAKNPAVSGSPSQSTAENSVPTASCPPTVYVFGSRSIPRLHDGSIKEPRRICSASVQRSISPLGPVTFGKPQNRNRCPLAPPGSAPSYNDIGTSLTVTGVRNGSRMCAACHPGGRSSVRGGGVPGKILASVGVAASGGSIAALVGRTVGVTGARVGSAGVCVGRDWVGAAVGETFGVASGDGSPVSVAVVE